MKNPPDVLEWILKADLIETYRTDRHAFSHEHKW